MSMESILYASLPSSPPTCKQLSLDWCTKIGLRSCSTRLLYDPSIFHQVTPSANLVVYVLHLHPASCDVKNSFSSWCWWINAFLPAHLQLLKKLGSEKVGPSHFRMPIENIVVQEVEEFFRATYVPARRWNVFPRNLWTTWWGDRILSPYEAGHGNHRHLAMWGIIVYGTNSFGRPDRWSANT